jgi:hypothetical protein
MFLGGQMTNDSAPAGAQHSIPTILIAAVLQGVALYGLHLSVEYERWPATNPAWLLALYAIAAFVPVTAQLLCEHIRDRVTWVAVAAVAIAFFYFGWHHGANATDGISNRLLFERAFPLTFVLTLLWLLWLPFVQCRLLAGRWQLDYKTLFAAAWRNKLTLAEAVLFTGLFWLLLVLWGQLFKMLGIDFFKELFERPIFIYPVTALAFGFALYMVGSVSRLVTVVLEQVLNVLKWLAVIAGLILALFTVALALKLPALVSTGARAIGAAWLLWLVAVMVLLINAAYRDGGIERPYPRWIALGLRGVVPLLTVIALTAGYAMSVRILAHGLTIGRFWGLVVAAAAGIYAFGYAYVAVRGRSWMAGIERVNIAAALFLIAVTALAMTPVLSPYRFAAASQYRRALVAPLTASEPRYRRQTALDYLRFEAGRYGRDRLAQLANLQDHPRAVEINRAARELQARENPWDGPKARDARERIAEILIYPAERSLEPELIDRIAADLRPSTNQTVLRSDVPLNGLFIDMDGDAAEEFVLLAPEGGLLYARQSGRSWYRVGEMEVLEKANTDLTTAVKSGAVKTSVPRWRTLEVGGSSFRIQVRQD